MSGDAGALELLLAEQRANPNLIVAIEDAPEYEPPDPCMHDIYAGSRWEEPEYCGQDVIDGTDRCELHEADL